MGFAHALILLAVTGSLIIAGIFFAFSNFVMLALKKIPESSGIQAMQSINRTVLNPLFLLIFFGTGAALITLCVLAKLTEFQDQSEIFLAAAFYLLGCLAVTMVRNVPMNKSLDRIQLQTPESYIEWRKYTLAWSRWNSVRALASCSAGICLLTTFN